MSAINKQYKHSPEVRAYLAKCKRDYRAKQKQKAEAAELAAQTASASNIPDKTHKALKEAVTVG